MHFRDGHIVVMDGLIRCRGAVCVHMVCHLAGMYLRHSHGLFRMVLPLLFPQLLLQPHFQMVMKRHLHVSFPGAEPRPNCKNSIQIKLMNTVITRLFKKSANKLPTKGISRYAFTEGEYLSQMACMLAMALGVAPMPKPQVPDTITAAS